MPVSAQAIKRTLIPNLLATLVIGKDMPRFAQGVANGVSSWVRKIKVQTTDAGTAGAGKGTLPIILAPPVLILNITRGMAQMKLLGPFAPPFIAGLSNGLSLSFAQMLASTTHPSVGVGAGVPRYVTPPATLDLVRGFKQAGLKGGDQTEKFCRALAIGLETSFKTLVIPIPIAGPPSPSPSSGAGSGSII
jgi:hypothetical protein